MELGSVKLTSGHLGVPQGKASVPKPEEQAPAFQDGYEQLSPAEQKQCKDLLTLLAAKGRLFKHTEGGALAPASALEAYRALRSGDAEIEDVVATNSKTTHESSTTNNSFYQDYYAGFDTALHRKQDSVETTVLGYSTSPVPGLADLLWLDTEANGIPGGESLPHSGRGTVVVAKDSVNIQDDRRHYYELNQPEYQTVDRNLEEQRRRLHGR